jgi:hypothetical protein
MTVRRLFSWLFGVGLFTMAVRETLDPDMWWHLRTGEYILQNGIPQKDIFSFTVQHHEWITHEWLSQLFMWGIYQVGGLPVLIVVFALLIALSFWLIYVCCEGRPYLAAFVAMLAAFASAIVWGVRPQIFNLLLTAVFILIVERYRQGIGSKRAIWLLPVFSVLWANLHSGYLLGIVLLGTYTIGAALDRWLGSEDHKPLSWAKIRRLGAVTAVSFLTAAINPNGVELWIYPFLTLGSSAMQVYIQEWHSPDFHQPFFWPFVCMMGLGVMSWQFSGKRPSWTEMLLFFGTVAAGLLSARHIPLFALVSIPIVTRHLLLALKNTALAPWVHMSQVVQPPTRRLLTLLNWGIFIAAIFVSFVWSTNKIIGNDNAVAERYPVTAIDFLESEGLANQPGYNSYNWGGYLIWRNIPVFVDGRADVYGDAFLFYYLQAFELRQNWQEPLDEFNVAYVLMERGSPLNNALLATGDWEQAYSDHVAQIYVRQSP